MAKIEQFEDLQSWQKARQLTNLIYDFTEHPKFCKDLRLSSQIQDASGSVMHNIAEGFDAGRILNSSGFSKYPDDLRTRYNPSSILRLIETT